MLTGTNYFVSFADAMRYYAAYGFEAKDIGRKIAVDEIKVGVPNILPGESLVKVDDGARYAIQEASHVNAGTQDGRP